ncbi:aminodeoxychorismate/anthranilate synthase component II [Christiangramia sp. OXR-203]|uniref:anthranilate synthase component II n=1 Tax=Christiangramia sp. OXR-203 TaxID=3100176 RepID=UPI002AC89959|nr:aminodeoxychorismate/anthranilate synthase component II [Christiangramia sp. OXR-203]WPZ00090.1 aminodeoxychorismate/anthranilate synthase component II [Christiangramia sp. OXR-203]
MKKILVIDNYDSFVYNLVHYLEELDCKVTVKRNDQLYLEDMADYDKILLSPGPGIPDEAGLLKQIIMEYGATKSILGVCLGMQAIGEVYGGTLLNLKEVYHGVATSIEIFVEDEYLYSGLEKELEVGRYHSWVVAKELPPQLEATSYDIKGEVMSLRHREFDVRGVQFHPESVLTPDGKKMIKNWVEHESSPETLQNKENEQKTS